MDANQPQRIAKFLAGAGIGSRRYCEELIAAKLVRVNDQLVESPAERVTPGQDRVFYRDQEIELGRRQYIVLNKPPGFTCSAADAHAEHLVTELFPDHGERLFTVGRLDRDSEGLLICTNDGDFAQRIAHPRNEVPKKYLVWVNGVVFPAKIRRLLKGIVDKGDRLRPLSLRIRDRLHDNHQTVLEFVIAEGKNREIRRLCRNCDWQVRRLQRTQIGPLKLGQLAVGAWRGMADEERQALLNFAEWQG